MEFRECEGGMSCGTNLCLKGVPCFNITDFDSNDTFPDGTIAIVTIEDARNGGNEELIFANNSNGNFNKLVLFLYCFNCFATIVMKVTETGFVVQYQISNVSSYTELTEVHIPHIYFHITY